MTIGLWLPTPNGKQFFGFACDGRLARENMMRRGKNRRYYIFPNLQPGSRSCDYALSGTTGRASRPVAQRGMGLVLDNILIFLVIGLAIGACVVTPAIMLMLIRHKARVELDHYGKYRGSGPAKSFVCPECLTRSYAPSHIARRWCAKCEKSFPERKPKVWKPEAQAAE